MCCKTSCLRSRTANHRNFTSNASSVLFPSSEAASERCYRTISNISCSDPKRDAKTGALTEEEWWRDGKEFPAPGNAEA